MELLKLTTERASWRRSSRSSLAAVSAALRAARPAAPDALGRFGLTPAGDPSRDRELRAGVVLAAAAGSARSAAGAVLLLELPSSALAPPGARGRSLALLAVASLPSSSSPPPSSSADPASLDSLSDSSGSVLTSSNGGWVAADAISAFGCVEGRPFKNSKSSAYSKSSRPAPLWAWLSFHA